MKINEAVAKAMLTNERAFKDISEAQATRIVKATLAEIAREIDGMDEGKLAVPGFGSFNVKTVEREKDGQKVALKRILARVKIRKAGLDEEDAADDEAEDD